MSPFPYRDDWDGVINVIPHTDLSGGRCRPGQFKPEIRTDTEEAVRTLERIATTCISLGKGILYRAAKHLEDRLEHEIFGPIIRLQELGQAEAIIKGLGHELDTASQALHEAAEYLKGAGKVMPANRAYQAHLRLRERAQEILGG